MSAQIEGRWSHEDYCSAVEAEIGRVVETMKSADPATEVPTCPGWTIAKLSKHLGITHRWAGHIVRHRLGEPVSTRQVPITLPEDDMGYPAWLAEGLEELVATFRAADPAAPVWSWGADQHAGFWSRRMLHESTIHRADAEIALGREPRIDARTATDGVEEFLSNLSAADWITKRLKEFPGSGERLHLHATDVDGEWTITLDPEGFTWERGHGKGDVAVRGPVSDLLLLLYGRLKPSGERFDVFGDRELLGRWLGKTSF